MLRQSDAPFPRGDTFYNGGLISVPPTGDFIGGFEYEGQEFDFLDSHAPKGGYGTDLTVRVRCVRNSTGAAVKPGQLVSLLATTRSIDGAAVKAGTNANTIARTTAAHCFPADEYLPTGGVPDGDLFYVVVAGPCLLKTAAGGTVTVALDQKVVSGTMAGTTSVDAGAVVAQDTTGATDALFAQIQNAVGRAMSATTASNTTTAILVNVGW